jgi:hypothetical protein
MKMRSGIPILAVAIIAGAGAHDPINAPFAMCADANLPHTAVTDAIIEVMRERQGRPNPSTFPVANGRRTGWQIDPQNL